MRFRTIVAILVASAGAAAAQDRMADTLRSGIVEEDSRQNPGAALRQYQTVMAQFGEARRTAATALYRMAECYRKLGNRPQAIASYQRVMREFADQPPVAEQSRVVLETTYMMSTAGATDARDRDARDRDTRAGSDKAAYDKLLDTRRQEQAKIRDARARYRATLQQEIGLVKTQIRVSDERYKRGNESIEAGNNLRRKLIQLNRDLAAFDTGMTSAASR